VESPRDTSVSTDTSLPEDTYVAPEADADRCESGAFEDRGCGKCGRQWRVCKSTGEFGAWGPCKDEISGAECSLGETRTLDCGNCGKQIDTCDFISCTWVTGSCTGEGECAPCDVDYLAGSCSTPLEVRARMCSPTCKWPPIAPCRMPTGWAGAVKAPVGFEGRINHASVFAGETIVFGGQGAGGKYFADTAAYRVASSSWRTFPPAPSAFSAGRARPTMVSDGGTKVYIFGGHDGTKSYADAASLDVSTSVWTTTTATPLSPRFAHVAVWSTTTKTMIVWGGCTGAPPCSSYLADGASYDPASGSWTTLPPSPLSARGNATAVWTGSEMIVWGGNGALGSLGDGARYEPSSRTWTMLPSASAPSARRDHVGLWTGASFVVFGGRDSTPLNTGAIYTPTSGWKPMKVPTDVELPPMSSRNAAVGVFNAGKLMIYGGADPTGNAIGGFGVYELSTDAWLMPKLCDPADPARNWTAPSARARASVVWTGTEAVIFGGGSSALGTGAFFAEAFVYRP